MSGPNRKMRRAMEARQRKAGMKQAPVGANELVEVAVLQKMYDQKAMQLQVLQDQNQKLQAMLAGALVELAEEGVTISVETMEALRAGVVSGFNVVAQEDGGVFIEVVFEEDGDDADEAETNNDDEAE